MVWFGDINLRTVVLWGSRHASDLHYVDNCVNHFLHCNRSNRSWTNDKCEYVHLVQYNPLLND